MAVLVADRADKLPIACQSLELRNERIPPLGVARNGHAIPVVFIAKFIVDQGIAKDAITLLNHAHIIGERIGIAHAVQHDERNSANTFDGLLRLYLECNGETVAQRYAHNTDVDALHESAGGRGSNDLIASGKQTQVGAKEQR